MRHSNTARLTPRSLVRGDFKAFVAAALIGVVCSASALAAETALPGDDQVVASRGGVDVTFAEIDARVMELPREVRGTYMTDPRRLEETVNGLLLEKQLAAKAKELESSGPRDPYLELQLEQARYRFFAQRAQRLDEERTPLPDFEELAEEKYLVDPDKFSGQVMLDLTHLLVTDRGRTDAEARARAEEARKLALEGKRGFPELVAEYTDEKTKGATSTGNLPKVVRGVMVPEFDEAAFALTKPGQISDIVKTRYGYHVIRLNSRTEPTPRTFEQVKAQIVTELRREYLSERKSGMVAELRSMKIEAVPERVAALRNRYTADGPRISTETDATSSR